MSTDQPQTNEDARAALQQHFGFTRFLDGQEEVVDQILRDQDICVVMPTGAGKSLCYQLPVLMRPGYGLIVSPLISLMKDQVDALLARNIPAAYINSTVPPREQHRLMWETANGQIKLLYVAPERFRAPAFRRLVEETAPRMLVVDEAHCISQWGHDFRPDYLRMGEVISSLSIPQVCAFTATATPLVREDICLHLQRSKMQAYVAGFQRPNLSFSVIDCRSKQEKHSALAKILRAPKPTIIYTSTRKAVDEVAEEFGCTPYHAGMSDEDRTAAQELFMRAPCPVLVATNAFGMGIDRADVRRVVHYNIPGSLEAYYQEAGRAGRDGEPADCVLLFAYHDRFIQEFLIDLNNPSESLTRDVYDVLVDEVQRKGSDQLELKLAQLQEMVGEAKSDRQISSVLRILEKHGYVERGYRRDNEGFLRFRRDIEELRLVHQAQASQRARFIYRCITSCGPALQTGISITYNQLCAIAGLRIEQVQRVIRALEDDVLDWSPPFKGRMLRLTRPQERELQIDFAEVERKRQFELARLEDVLGYTRATECRQQSLVSYFGQDVDGWRCETCDLCQRMEHAQHREPTDTEMATIRTILETVHTFEGRFGRGRIAQVLAGSKNQEIMRWNLPTHPRYGALAHVGSSHLLRFLNSLQKAGCIMQVGDSRYPCIDVTPLGISVIDGDASVKLDFPAPEGKEPVSRRSRERRGRPRRSQADDGTAESSRGTLDSEGSDLFERLRELRKELAGNRGIPAYRILTDDALAGLVAETPITPEEATRIKGIGRIKARTVVPTFLRAIREWREELG